MKKIFTLAALAAMTLAANAQSYTFDASTVASDKKFAVGDNVSSIEQIAIYNSEAATGSTKTYYTDETHKTKSGDDKKGKTETAYYIESVNETSLRDDEKAPSMTANGVEYAQKRYLQGSTNGMFFAFVPKSAGTLDVAIKMGSKKASYVAAISDKFYSDNEMTGVADLFENSLNTISTVLGMDDTDNPTITFPEVTATVVNAEGEAADGFTRSVNNDSINKSGDNQYMVLSFAVKAGQTYMVGCNGSKLMLRAATLRATSTGISEVADEKATEKAVKALIDGQLVIKKNGKKYTVAGAEL